MLCVPRPGEAPAGDYTGRRAAEAAGTLTKRRRFIEGGRIQRRKQRHEKFEKHKNITQISQKTKKTQSEKTQ